MSVTVAARSGTDTRPSWSNARSATHRLARHAAGPEATKPSEASPTLRANGLPLTRG